MAQSNTVHRESVTYYGAEATFGTNAGASLVRLHCLADDLSVEGLQREMLDNGDDRQVRWDNPQKIQGLKLGSKVTLKVQLKEVPAAARLDAGGSAAALSQRALWTHALGREYAALGCTVGVGSTTLNVVVDDTSTLRPGQLVLVETSAGTFEPARVSQVTDATHFKVAQAFTTAPTTGLAVRGTYGYYWTQDQNDSLVIERKFTNGTGLEYRMMGVHGAVKWDFPDWGKVPTVSLDGECVDWQGPTTLAAPVFGTSTPAADDEGSPQLWQPVCYLATAIQRKSADPSYTAPYCLEKLALEIPTEWEKTHDGSRTHTVGGVHKVSGRPTAAKGSLSIRVDPGEDALFDAGTERNLLAWCKSASGAFFIVEIPALYITAKPKVSKLGKRLGLEVPFEVRRDPNTDAGVGPTTEAQEMAWSPVRIARG